LRSLNNCFLRFHPGLSNRQYAKNLEVLDVGSGTGAYIKYWQSLGIEHITGVDITSVSIRNLRKSFPNLRFHHLDITDDSIPKVLGKKFDIISAMNVLLHITDEEKFTQAISNMSEMLKDSGLLLIADPIFIHRYWGRPFTEESSSKCRPLDQYLLTFASKALSVVGLCPTTFLMSDPIDTNGKMTFRIWRLLWRCISVLAKNEESGAIVGGMLYIIEGVLARMFKHTQYRPTGKFMLAEKRPLAWRENVIIIRTFRREEHDH
jgi:SAM-dependent methyltransferase